MPRQPDPDRTTRADRDRRASQAQRLRRVLAVLQLLRSRGRYNVKAIAQELGCSERTVFRDLDVLGYAGVHPCYDEVERCYHLPADCDLPALPLSSDEAFGQAIAAALGRDETLGVAGSALPVTRRLLAEASPATRRVLADAATLVDAFNLQLADHRRSREVIRSVQHALLGMKRLAGRYESPHESAARRLVLHPYRLCFVKASWYLVARIEGEEAPKTFRVARFQSLRVLSQASRVPPDFDLREYFGNAWAVYRGSETYDVKVWFSREAAPLVLETVWHRTQKSKRGRDGSVVLTFQVDGLEEITRWVLGWTGDARVLSPRELYERVVERLETALELHADAAED